MPDKPLKKENSNIPSQEDRIDDTVLMRRVADRDELALETLMSYWKRPVFSLAMRILGNEATAEEVSQDVFFKVWKNAHVFTEKRGAFSSWVLTMTHHSSIDALRRAKSRGSRVTQALDDVLSAVIPLPEKGISTWQSMRLAEAMETLPEKQKKVVELAYFEGQTREAMAKILKEPVGTVKTRLRDAIQKLSSVFSDPETEMKSIADFEA
jgi:RNA polymerase sigma-70 factor (ECF subfamily)